MRTAALGALAVVCLLSTLDAWQQPRLNPAIGPAHKARYRAIKDARDWRNPIITIRADDVVVEVKGIAERKSVPVERLRSVLIELPVKAWPYGRVVVQSDQSILPVPWEDYMRRMGETRDRVASILEDLGILVERWPSA